MPDPTKLDAAVDTLDTFKIIVGVGDLGKYNDPDGLYDALALILTALAAYRRERIEGESLAHYLNVMPDADLVLTAEVLMAHGRYRAARAATDAVTR